MSRTFERSVQNTLDFLAHTYAQRLTPQTAKTRMTCRVPLCHDGVKNMQSVDEVVTFSANPTDQPNKANEKSTHHRHHRTGRGVPGRIPPGQGI